MARSHPETWLITENNVRRTNTGEEGLRETKNNAFGSATEDEEGNISYEELKMSTQDRSRWSQWRWKPAIWQSTTEREREREAYAVWNNSVLLKSIGQRLFNVVVNDPSIRLPSSHQSAIVSIQLCLIPFSRYLSLRIIVTLKSENKVHSPCEFMHALYYTTATF